MDEIFKTFCAAVAVALGITSLGLWLILWHGAGG